MEQEIEIDHFDTLSVIFYSILTTIFAEFGMWLMFYSKQEYKELKKNITNMSKKLEKQKEQFVLQNKQKQQEKKKQQYEGQFKAYNQEMTAYRMKSTILIGLFMIIVLNLSLIHI
eukprot:TRINITY_DN4003_c0_g1_i1.p1 TRINITY_DN4003_c0_g1~~TRINITY_DN4003_c0_g1_i1.p1  ORF type:complete len:115 (-),score=30.07 TRINITY_DN4003_c0_g1_i1:60-404(-)